MGLGPPVADAEFTPESGTPTAPMPHLPTDEHDDPSLRATDRISLPATLTESGPAPRDPRADRSNRPTPRGVAPPPIDDDDWALSNARTLEMPRVRNGGAGSYEDAADELRGDDRRRAELATTNKTHGLLRSPDAGGSNAGRYSVRDVSTEYVDTGAPGAIDARPLNTGAGPADRDLRSDPPPALEDDSPEVTLEADADDFDASAGLDGDTSRPRRSTPKQRVGHRRSSRPEIGHARERGTKRTDPGIRARTLRGGAGASVPGSKSQSQPPQLPAAKTQPSAALPVKALPSSQPITKPTRIPLAARDPGSVVIDPSLSQPSASSALVKHEPSGYVPLPRDREAYEAFLRSAAGEHGGTPRARPSWAQQETALIPRDMLQPSFEDEADPGFWRGPWFRGVLGVILIVVSAAVLWWILREDRTGASRPVELAPAAQPTRDPAPPSAARAITLIATEPGGAELLLDNAVIGNTPFEVARPAQGEVLYMVRLRNFEHQMVRVTSATHDAIHITLVPVAAEPPPVRKR